MLRGAGLDRSFASPAIAIQDGNRPVNSRGILSDFTSAQTTGRTEPELAPPGRDQDEESTYEKHYRNSQGDHRPEESRLALRHALGSVFQRRLVRSCHMLRLPARGTAHGTGVKRD